MICLVAIIALTNNATLQLERGQILAQKEYQLLYGFLRFLNVVTRF